MTGVKPSLVLMLMSMPFFPLLLFSLVSLSFVSLPFSSLSSLLQIINDLQLNLLKSVTLSVFYDL